MEVPPICPKTIEVFSSGVFDLALTCSPRRGYGYCLSSFYESDRRFIGRYQACAWQDRSARWMAVARRANKSKVIDHWLELIAFDECEECLRRADAWREWERLP